MIVVSFTLAQKLDDATKFIGHMTMYKNDEPVKTFRIEADTQKEFDTIAQITREYYAEYHSDEVSQATTQL